MDKLKLELFIHLHVHTEYSNIRLLDSTNKIERMLEYVASLGQKGLAITDHEALCGHVKFIQEVKRLKKEGVLPNDFKPILGNEIYLVDEEQMNEGLEKGGVKFNHFLLLAKDSIGHEQLRELSSRAWRRMFNYRGMERVPTFYSDIEEVVGENKGHIIASTACLGGLLGQKVLHLLNAELEEDKIELKTDIHEFICWCMDMFGDDFYIEIQPSQMEEQISFNKMAITIADAYKIKYIVTTDAHYLTEQDREVHKAYLTSDEEGGSNREVDDFYSSTHFFTEDMIRAQLCYLSDEQISNSIINTYEIANKIEEYDLAHKQIIPKVKLPSQDKWFFDLELFNIAQKYENIKAMLNSEEQYDRYLINIAFKGLRDKINKGFITRDDYEETFERINTECFEIIGSSKAKEEPLSSYFVTMAKYIDIIWDEAQCVVAPGRGSAGGYIINYLVGITQINPLKQGIEMPHWRFISAERPDYPDIDIDVSSHKRDLVFKKVQAYLNSIGGDIVRVATFGTETAKSAIQTSCRGLKINNDVGTYLSSLIPVERGKVWSIHDCYYGNPSKGRPPVTEFKNIVDTYSDRKLLEVALGIEGLINKRSSHACFDAETLITTSKGLKRIVDVEKGDLVLTHSNRFQPVVDLIETRTNTVYKLKTQSSFPVEVTGNHPFYVREMTKERRKKIFSEPKWKEVSELDIDTDYIGIPINKEAVIPYKTNLHLPFESEDFWWITGRYLGDGWTEHYERMNNKKNKWVENRIIICCSKVNNKEKNEIVKHLSKLKFIYRVEEARTTYKIYINNEEYYQYLQGFGKYAHGKYINEDVFNLPEQLVKIFLEGYISADGHYYKDANRYCIKTVSKKLAIGVMQLINKAYHKHAGLGILPPKTEFIEGRKVDSKEKYEVRFSKVIKPNEKSFFENDFIWTKISILNATTNERKMYNLTILNDSSYVANGLCVHNCGVVPVNEAITKHNAVMRTPSGELITQFDLHDSEYCGNLKYDFLNTKTCGMIQVTLEMLVNHRKIEWQGSLRATYDKYLHPDVIDIKTLEMWELLNRGELISAFQFDSMVGEMALKAIKPVSLLQATDANNLMRLMGEDGKEQPLDMYVRYKDNIEAWFDDMREFGLSDREIEIVKKHLLKNYGTCSTQEGMMMLSMDDDIAGFNVVEANTLRKGVAKKVGEKFEEAHKLLYEKGLAKGASKTLLDYIWDVQIAMQRGYGFSLLHGIEYTYILIQQLNLVYYYPSVYWNTAVLLVESGALEQDTSNDENENTEKINRKEKTTSYGTIAKAIGNMQSKGVTIALPDINTSLVGFEPNDKDNEIMFGLKGIMGMNNETARLIMENRPFTSLEDFHEKMVLTKRQVTLSTGKTQNKSLVSEGSSIMLVKSGAFDKIENKPREEVLEKYLNILNPDTKKITAKTTMKIIEMGIVPIELKDEIRFFKFREYIKDNCEKFNDETSKTIKWYSLRGNSDMLTEYTMNFFLEHFASGMTEEKDYKYGDDGVILVALGTSRKGSFEDIYKTKIANLTNWLNSEECIQMYNKNMFNEVKNKYMQGGISSWEMESMNYYYHEHELSGVNAEKYCVVDYNTLPEEPKVIGFTTYRKMQYPKFELTRIVGTVLDKDKNKHTVILLTPTGVVSVKFYSGQFAFYDKQISRLNDDGSKTTLEDGWFKRGNLLMVTGFRRGDQFRPKRYKDSVFQHSVQKISDVKDSGDLVLISDRVRVDEDNIN